MTRRSETATGPEPLSRGIRRLFGSTARRVLLLIGLLQALFAPLARAQDVAGTGLPEPTPDEQPKVDPNAVTPPRLLAFVDAGYPEQARALQLDAAVLLRITIGADGFVEEASLVGDPIGNGFDELALSAARRFVFEPAAKGGEPMRSRIQYAYEFKYQATPAPGVQVEQPVAHATPEARVTVSVRSGENDKPLVGVEVLITSETNPTFAERLVTDAQGRVGSRGLLPGRYGFNLSRKDLTGERNVEDLPEGETTELTYRMLPAPEAGDEYGAVAVVKAPAREVTRRTIERDVLTRVAGTRGDALRAIELLPGVGRPPFTAGQILIRGAGPSDSQVFLDGVPVPLLYHFGGLTSFINSRALDRIDFYPGNFSARYGRATGGIVDVGVRDPQADKYHGVLDINLPLDSSLLLEGPITDKASFMVAGRRSYFGNLATAIIPKGTFGAFAAPVYSDFQSFITYRPTDRDKLRLGFYGDSDRLKILFAKSDDDPTIKSLQVGQSFQRAQLGWKRQYSAKLEHDIQFALGRETNMFRLPPSFDFALKSETAYLRAEWRYRMSDTAQIIIGTDSTASLVDVTYDGPSPPGGDDSSGNGASLDALPANAYKKTALTTQAAVFVEVALQPTKKLRVVPGLRLDYFQITNKFNFDPRVAAIYSLSDRTRVKAGVGVYSQPPQPPYSIKGLGNPDLLWTKAIHYSVGVEHSFSDDYSLNLEGFYKSIYDNVVGTDYAAAAAMGNTSPPPFDNDGKGRIYGLEVLGRKQAKGRWFGFVSYTLMRSERKDHNQPWRVYNYDQTHILSLACGVKLGRGWEGGATFRVITGNPYTPTAGASLDQDIASFTGADGRQNSARNPTFNRLDLRVEKMWKFDKWRLALYLDVQNSYNAVNREAIQYSFNYKQTAPVRGLPIIPVLGLRGEL